MNGINFNHGWEFTLQNSLDEFSIFGFEKYTEASGAASRFYEYDNWQRVDLPHDWAVALKKDINASTFAGARANTHYHRAMTGNLSPVSEVYNVGWYRKQFATNPEWKGKRVFLEFEGVFRDSIVWVNGVYQDRHNSGYTGFTIEITDHLVEDGENSVAVRVDSDQAEGWWYEGAGIYRNVRLWVSEPVYFKNGKTVIKTELDGSVSASCVLYNDSDCVFDDTVTFEIKDAQGNIACSCKKSVCVQPYTEQCVSTELKVNEPRLWSVEDPNLYELNIKAGDESQKTRFGIRTVGFDSERGFLLNGKPVKIRGACVHQDFGGVGVALSDNLNRYKIQRLKDMGVNAYRSAHHAPSPALLDACDELGMLVMDETRAFGTSAEAIRQLTSLMERDRNHPCVFIWSLGNEEFSVQNTKWSYRLMQKATRIAKSLDDTRPVTYGGNNGANFDGANGAAEIRGVNYIRNGGSLGGRWLDVYHAEHPHQPIIGTEESSYVLSRGGAVNEVESSLLDSSGMVTMPWGSTPKGWVKYSELRPYFAGSFMWTGFDYRGEPNPFIYANVSSSFGTIDLCGMEKPPFYYYKAWWTDEPVLKITPHWNFKKGEKVSLSVFTNCESVTLSINGRTVEKRRVERFDAPIFEVEFEPGTVCAEGERNGKIYRDELKTAKRRARYDCRCVLEAKSEDDIAIYEINALDSDGTLCPLDSSKVKLSAKNAKIIGVGNGDPANLDYEQRLPQEDAIVLRTFNYEKGVYSVPHKVEYKRVSRYDWIEKEYATESFEDDFRIVARYKNLHHDTETLTFTTKVSNVEGYEYLEFERLEGAATVYLNGKKIGSTLNPLGKAEFSNVRPFRFYCKFKRGENEIRVESCHTAGEVPMSGYVKIAKQKDEPWTVRLHYGKARVFVKSTDFVKSKLIVKPAND